jgi:hypothetical protein
MKPNRETENDERLSAVLREWKVDVSLPPRFQEQVWRRVSRAEAQAGPSLRQVFARWVETTFSRPALAVSYVTVLLFIGLTTGYVRAQDKSAQAQSQWRAMYVQSVDPYQAPRSN